VTGVSRRPNRERNGGKHDRTERVTRDRVYKAESAIARV
jgi:hypothetical protein